MNRIRFLRGSRRNFSTSETSSCSSAGTGKRPENLILSGGKSSYIGLGKFEGMGGENGNLTKALEYLRDALKAHTSVQLSPDQRREEARFYHDIAMCHHRDGNVDGALSDYRRVVSLLEKLLVETPSDANTSGILRRARFDISSAFSGISVALADKDANEEALDYALKALEIRKSIMGSNHASVAECLNTLGGLYFRQENFNKAAEVYQESLRILLTKTQGKEENKYVALAYYNIGLTYNKLGINKGRDAVFKAYLIAEHIFGTNHDQTMQIKQSLDEMDRR